MDLCSCRNEDDVLAFPKSTKLILEVHLQNNFCYRIEKIVLTTCMFGAFLGMVHPENIVRDELEAPKEVINDVKTISVVVDIRPQFTNEMTFACREYLLEWETKLHGHLVVCQLNREEMDSISELSMIKVEPRNILADLKRKRPNSVSNIKAYEDKDTVRDIFWTHPESIKLFNIFLTVLIIDSTYKTNKYRLPFLEIVGVTSTDKTFSVGFAFLECEKEDNVTWDLGICKTLLVDQNNMPSDIVIDRDNALMNAVGTVFPTSTALLCRYHLTSNVRSNLKIAVGTKEKKDENGNIIKPGVVVEKIIGAWKKVLDSCSEDLYTENVSKAVAEHQFKGKNLCSQLIYNISCAELNFIFHEARRAETTGPDSSKCGCTIRKTYGLPCACILSKKMQLNSPIRMDEVSNHWKKLRFDDYEPAKEGESKITITAELEEIMDKFSKADDTVKLHIKEQL
ncbi:uncharacterized protein LOC131620037 [Vicia villosa]|uniref:uncharacterized protein LOC131620037 n=1 Tax=Vicia villosa TaxID=3911 RepID=UPI00273AA4DC|nr:uncharacterized protein LOC131620037 [Vicia villosa]